MFAIVNGKEIPEYYGKPYVEINKEPFSDKNKKIEKFEVKKDKIGGLKKGSEEKPIHTVYACLNREHISSKRNRGNKNKDMPDFFYKTYNCLKWKNLYNNCHLIAYQLSGDNSDENLIIGTRYMNEIGMSQFENKVKVYMKETGHHVLYRVTPVFNENEQLIKGVQMEAYSLEDEGVGICFNVFVYNVQPGIDINYKDGNSKEDKEWLKNLFPNKIYTDEKETYILNMAAHKFHKKNRNGLICNEAKNIGKDNKKEIECPRQFLIDNGFKPCNNCNP